MLAGMVMHQYGQCRRWSKKRRWVTAAEDIISKRCLLQRLDSILQSFSR